MRHILGAAGLAAVLMTATFPEEGRGHWPVTMDLPMREFAAQAEVGRNRMPDS